MEKNCRTCKYDTIYGYEYPCFRYIDNNDNEFFIYWKSKEKVKVKPRKLTKEEWLMSDWAVVPCKECHMYVKNKDIFEYVFNTDGISLVCRKSFLGER